MLLNWDWSSFPWTSEITQRARELCKDIKADRETPQCGRHSYDCMPSSIDDHRTRDIMGEDSSGAAPSCTVHAVVYVLNIAESPHSRLVPISSLKRPIFLAIGVEVSSNRTGADPRHQVCSRTARREKNLSCVPNTRALRNDLLSLRITYKMKLRGLMQCYRASCQQQHRC